MKMDNPSNSNRSEAGWKALYITGGIAALAAVLVFRRNWGVELMTFSGFGIFNVPEIWPVSALEWFELLQNDKFIGLSLLGLYDMIEYALVGLIFLALYGVLRGANRGARLFALACGLIGITIALNSNPAFDMLALSDRHAAATTTNEQSLFLAAGEALLAHNNPAGPYHGTGYYTSLFLVLVAGLVFSIVMSRSDVFGKWVAISGILTNGAYLLLFPFIVFAPAIIWLPPSFAALFRVVWYILIVVRLFKLSFVK
jgi:hypothetical protein